MTFHDLGLMDSLLKAIDEEGYSEPTPIQEQAIPPLLSGRDILACAQTGTGKTAAFALPILQYLAQNPRDAATYAARALVLSPTRELALQIDESFEAYGRHLGLSHTVIYGGMSHYGQTKDMHAGIDVLVATPGRLLDLMSCGFVRLEDLEILVLDEADRMLDMGFIDDIRKVVAAAPNREQTMCFSATLPNDIVKLANRMLTDPVQVEVAPETPAAENIDQRLMFVDQDNKRELLTDMIHALGMNRTLVFTRTKHGAERLARQLSRADISASAIHGDKTQKERERALERFKAGQTDILVATDVASRGLDIDAIEYVVNYELPRDPETYVHRIGRTARAGATGVAVTFCDASERRQLKSIEKLLNDSLRIVTDHPYHSESAAANGNGHASANGNGSANGSGRSRRGGRSRRRSRSGATGD